MTDSDLPCSTHVGTVRIFGVDLIVHNLDDGRRIIETESMAALFEAMASGDCGPVDLDELRKLLA